MPHHRQRMTVVITGASSGIGRATALAFAQPEYALVLAARRGDALEELAAECRGAGAAVLVAPVDVTDAEAMSQLARKAAAEFDRIDVWVNNASVLAYGRAEELPARLWRRVVEVNLFGAYHGVRAVLPWFREQGSGVLINVSSILGKVPSPYQSAYVTSKYAVRALSECLRQEVRDVKRIRICTVLPGAIDTPIFRSAANYTGYQVRPPGLPIDARRVAAAIVRCAQRPRREVVVGASTRAGLALGRVAPGLSERLVARGVEVLGFTDQPAATTEGNLFDPGSVGARIDDGWRESGQRPEWELARNRSLARAGATAAAMAAGAALAVGVAKRLGR